MRQGQNSLAASPLAATAPEETELRSKVRTYLVGNFLLGDGQGVDDDGSLMEAGILDSTGALEIVGFLETEFGLSVRDDEITADNLDSIARIGSFVERKLAARA